MKLLRPHQVEVAVARALERWRGDDMARTDAHFYLVAARLPVPPGADDRMWVPDFLADFADPKGASNE